LSLERNPVSGDAVSQFAAVSKEYARFRPRYPRAIFQWIASLVERHDLAWDCATGNGQAATGLAEDFAHVEATDASEDQLRHAMANPRITYRQAPAEHSGLADATVDVVTVAQALHWLPLDGFYAEVRRVLRPGGALVAFGYHLPGIGIADVDRAMTHFHDVIVGPYWRPERQLVVDRLRTIPFPFREIEPPEFEIQLPMSLATFGDFLRTQSATERYRTIRGEDPVPAFEERVQPFWGARDLIREVRFPMFVRAGRGWAGSG
jgi:SAM-dependent methyltransferase